MTATPGPGVPLRWGTLAIADPWFAPSVPKVQQISIGQGEQTTVLSTIAVPRAGQPEPAKVSCAAAIGAVDQVTSWQPLVHQESHFHLDCDSALGAFYDVTDSAVLRPLFEDDQHMQEVYNRALVERIVAMEVDGRVAPLSSCAPTAPASTRRMPASTSTSRRSRCWGISSCSRHRLEILEEATDDD